MGHPKFQKKKFKTPTHPWQSARMAEETILVKEYGLRRKKEIWKMIAHLRNWRNQAKDITALPETKREAATAILVNKLLRWGVIKEGSGIDEILSLSIKDIMERRLQTQLYKRGMATTAKQARQFIVHKKVVVNGVKITAPSYLVKAIDNVQFADGFVFVKPTKKTELAAKAVAVEGEEEPAEASANAEVK